MFIKHALIVSYFSHLPSVMDICYIIIRDGHENAQNSVSVLVPVKGQCTKFQLDFVQAQLQLVTDSLLTILQNPESFYSIMQDNRIFFED